MRVVQIGTGGWGKNHTRVLDKLNVLTAVCDADPQRSKEFGTKYDVNYYTSINDVLQSEEFDAAIISTPTSTHYPIASQLIKEGKHVFVEKPLTYYSDAGEKLLQQAKEKQIVLTCGYIERFNPAIMQLKEAVKSKDYGDLIMLEFHRESRMPFHIKDVGIIYDTSVHDIDTALWLFDDVPETVYAKTGRIRHEHEDFATIMLGFRDNHVAVISSNWITPTRVRTFNAVLTEAIISGDFISKKVKIEKESGTYIPRPSQQEPLMLEIKTFLDAINGKGELIVRPEEAVNVTKIAEAAIQSSKEGIPVHLEL
ncbi:MAG: Gfo/Idh/MocA family protein [Candidatus Kariarchaeaceae archaeon]|jgi:UDP-N-acetylglucosamine 3-dehydrogenase